MLQQQFVLKHASRENCRVEIIFSAKSCYGVRNTKGDAALKCQRGVLGRAPRMTITHQALQQRAEIQFLAIKGKRIRIICRSGARQLFEPYGRLSFEACASCKAEKRC